MSEAIAQAAVMCRRITKSFDEGGASVQALRGVDLVIPIGGLTMLVGPSGCGKTTLISIIAGLLAATDGELDVLGKRTPNLPGREQIRFRRRNVGFLFQQFNLLPALTAAENAAVPLFIAGWARKQAIERATGLLHTLGLEHQVKSFPSQLSGGQQQRLALARALIHEPRLVVCDEPTSALDAKTGHAVMELLSGVAVRPDCAVIVVTHDNRIVEFADRIAQMEDGRITQVEERQRRGTATEEGNEV